MNMNEDSMVSTPPVSDALRLGLQNLRRGLLRLHKVLLDGERDRYEEVFGRVASSGALLHLVIHDEQFAWLRSLSELIVRIDEMLDAEEPATPADAEHVFEQVRSLLKSSASGASFGEKYRAALQRDPDAVLAHAEVSKLLRVTNSKKMLHPAPQPRRRERHPDNRQRRPPNLHCRRLRGRKRPAGAMTDLNPLLSTY